MTTKPPADEFSISDWLVDGIDGLRSKRPMPKLMPHDVKSHLKSANREVLLALRSAIDSAIEWLEEKETPPKKVTKIKVE